MYRLFAHLSGLDRLVDLYPARTEPLVLRPASAGTGAKHTWQTVQVGPVVYRRCVTVHVGSEGLYLCVRPPFRRYPPLFIPWSEVSAVHAATLHWQRALRLSIGRPAVTTITCTGRLLQSIRPHLPEGLAPTA
jgi:hypothetical protein